MSRQSEPLTPPVPIDPLDVEDVLEKLTEKEKVDLLSGIDHWQTKAIPRLRIPSLRVSDGPNGVRGSRFFHGQPAACLPCGTALGATWDTDLLLRAGRLLGEESKAKGAHVLLAPTVNMQRGPLGGRGFESFSEDPVLSGTCAASIINGVQETEVVACIKHFVANDQEHERMAVDSLVTQRALREIYLLPFQIAIRDSRPRALMTAYNKVNGKHVSEDPFFLQHVLRREWAWQGLVMSDWYGTYSTSDAINAGLDLEMPGPSRWRGQQLTHALLSKKVLRHTLDARVREMLNLCNRASKTGVPEYALESTNDTPKTASLLRDLAASSIVLLKNEKRALPLQGSQSVAVIGPNARTTTYCGGGSASLQPYYAISPWEGIAKRTQHAKFSVGCYGHLLLPLLGQQLKTFDGEVGVTFKAFIDPPTNPDRRPVQTLTVEDTYMYLSDYSHPAIATDLWWAEVDGYFAPEESGPFEFGLTVFGTGKLFVDGKLVVDNETKQRSGGSFFNVGTVEETGIVDLVAGQTYKIGVVWASGVTSKLADADGVVSFGGGGIRIGGAKVINPDDEVTKAVELAKSVDQVVLCVGLNSDLEQEGHDRRHMDLPGHTDCLVHAVAAANPRTIVVVQSGTPVSMPWASDVSAIVQAWYGGNETGNAIADILYGDVNPSGKLPLSFPVRLEDNPTFFNFRSERGRVLYGEDVYIGYRFYETTKKQVLWPFGWGLSYTSFQISGLRVTQSSVDPTSKLTISVDVANTGTTDGAEVVQVYVSQRQPSIRRPEKELKGFKKVFVPSDTSQNVEIEIERKYATSFWDEERQQWVEESGVYDILVGTSSVEISARETFEVERTTWWSGL